MDDKDAQEEKKIESSNEDATFEEHKEKESSSE